jgi:hypothetical protein
MRALRCELLTWASGELEARHHLLAIVFGCGVYSYRTKDDVDEEQRAEASEAKAEAEVEAEAEAEQAEEVDDAKEPEEEVEALQDNPDNQLLWKVHACGGNSLSLSLFVQPDTCT